MTMHMVGPYLTTTSYRKREERITQRQREQWQFDWMEHNRQLKRQGEAKISFDAYVDYRHGRGAMAKTKIRPSQMGVYVEKNKPYRRETPHYPSLNMDNGVAVKKEVTQYTGTAMLGIGQLHKSNAIPVFSKEDAIDISKMRRG